MRRCRGNSTAKTSLALARGVGGEITFQKRDGYVVSAADVFVLLNTALESFIERQALVQAIPLETVYGPAREFKPSEGAASSRAYSWTAFAEAVRGTGAFVRSYKQLPAEIWIGSESLSPADYLATLAGAFVAVAASGAAPTQVERRTGRFTADQYVAADSPKLWSWPIFPPGFHAPGDHGAGAAPGVDVEARTFERRMTSDERRMTNDE